MAYSAGGKGDADAQRDRDVHPEPTQLQVAPGPAEERRRRVQDHRHGEDQARQPHELLDVGAHGAVLREIGRHRVHHHLHHPEARHEQTPQRAAVLALARLLGGCAAAREGAIADRLNRRQDLRQRDRAGSQRTRARCVV